MNYARIQDGLVAEIIRPFERLEADRPPAPDLFPEGYEPTAEEQAAHQRQQQWHDTYVVGIVPVEECFSADLIASLVPATDSVELGDTYADGVFGKPAPATPEAPRSVTRAQAKLALLAANLLDDVEQAIAGMTGDDLRRATIEWNERATFERQSPFLLQMAATLGLDDAGLDALFIDAANR